MSHLVRLCDRLLEAGCLLMLAGGVLYFSTHSGRGFEPDKVLMLRTFMIMMGAAWALRAWETGEWKPQRPGLVAAAVLGVGVTGAVSATMALEPLLSWQGSYLRLEGFTTTLLYLLYFAVLLLVVQGRAQVERLVTTVVLTLVPVCAYATLQRLGLDPLWGDISATRVGSTAGNAVALAAWLITALPFLVYRTVGLSRSWATLGLARRASLLGHLALLGWSGVVMIWTSGRGPTVGLGAAALFLGWLAVRRAPRARLGVADALKALALVLGLLLLGFLAGWLVLGLLLRLGEPNGSFAALMASLGGTGFLLVAGMLSGRGPRWLRLALLWWVGALVIGAGILNIPPERTRDVLPGPAASALEGWRQIPWVWRFSRLLDPGKSTGKVRAFLWEGALAQLQQGVHAQYPDGATDRLKGTRWLVGWGQETQALTFPQFYPPELAYLENREQRVDRLHNQTLDQLVTTGWLGLLAWHALYLTGILTGLRALGFPVGLRNVLGWVGGGALAGGTLLGLGSPLWVGVAVPFGCVLGLAASLRAPSSVVAEDWRSGLALTCVTVLVAHFLEIQVGFPLVPSSLMTFLALALLSRVGRLDPASQAEEGPLWEIVLGGFILSLIACELLGAVPYLPSLRQESDVPSVWTMLRNLPFADNQTRSFTSLAPLALLVSSWLGIWGLARGMRGDGLSGVRSLFLLLGPLGLPLVTLTAAAGPLRMAYFWIFLTHGELSVEGAVAILEGAFRNLLLVFWGSWLVAWIWLGGLLPREGQARGWFRRTQSQFLAPVLVGVAATLVWTWGLRPALADVLYAQVQNTQRIQAEQAGAAEGWQLPVGTLERVVELEPSVDMYYSFLGDFRGRQAAMEKEPQDRAHLRLLALEAMLAARNLAPLEPNNAANVGLSSLERVRAMVDPQDPTRPQLLQEARSEDYRAVRLNPFDVAARVEVGNRLLNDLGEIPAAQEQYRIAIKTDPRYFAAFYGLASALEREAITHPEGSPRRQQLLAAAAAAAYAGTRFEPAGKSRDERYKIMLLLYRKAGIAPPAGPSTVVP